MLLSEAIRLGAMLKPKGIGVFIGNNVSCALGAACDAIALQPGQSFVPVLKAWPWLEQTSRCPLKGCTALNGGKGWGFHVGHAITHLNDDHGWTREQIADWVATIEPKDAAVEPVVKHAAVSV